jgi:RCC1 and BTB domain-containing protein
MESLIFRFIVRVRPTGAFHFNAILGHWTFLLNMFSSQSFHCVTDSHRTWGGGMYGKLGHGNEAGSSTPKRVEALIGHCVALIACGSRHTVVVLSTGALYSWGDQDNGVAGHGDVANANQADVSHHQHHHQQQQQQQQHHHGAANNQEGGLHQQHLSHQYLPRLVERLAGKRVVQLSACGFHTGCLTDVGECYTWGGAFCVF